MNPDDIGSIKVYEGHLAYDFKDEEEGIVNSLFGSTSKKLEEISYQNSTAFLPFLYKYRKLRVELGEEKTKTEIDGKDVVVNDYSTYESAIKGFADCSLCIGIWLYSCISTHHIQCRARYI